MQFTGPKAAAKWVAMAEINLEEARLATEAGRFPIACYHAQQAAEIGLKALFILNGVDFEFTNSVVDLANALGVTYPELAGFRKEAAALTAYAITTRYPDKLTGISPLEIITEENATAAVEYATVILEACKKIYGQAVLDKKSLDG